MKAAVTVNLLVVLTADSLEEMKAVGRDDSRAAWMVDLTAAKKESWTADWTVEGTAKNWAAY